MLRWLESALQIAMGLNKCVWFCPSNSNGVNKSDSDGNWLSFRGLWGEQEHLIISYRGLWGQHV